MLRRFLTRLRFTPAAGGLFDRLPAFARWGWILGTDTLPPGQVYVPPGATPDPVRSRRRVALTRLLWLIAAGAAGFVLGGWTGSVGILMLVVIVFVLRKT